jgi:hypothetical protein
MVWFMASSGSAFRQQHTFSVGLNLSARHVTGSSVFVNESAIEDDPKLGATDRQRDSCEVPTPVLSESPDKRCVARIFTTAALVQAQLLQKKRRK